MWLLTYVIVQEYWITYFLNMLYSFTFYTSSVKTYFSIYRKLKRHILYERISTEFIIFLCFHYIMLIIASWLHSNAYTEQSEFLYSKAYVCFIFVLPEG